MIGTPRCKAGRTILSEAEGKALLEAYGIPVVPTITANDTGRGREGSGATCSRSTTSLVLKILSDDITPQIRRRRSASRSSEARTQCEAAAHDDAGTRRDAARPDARIAGFTLSPMIRRPQRTS